MIPDVPKYIDYYHEHHVPNTQLEEWSITYLVKAPVTWPSLPDRSLPTWVLPGTLCSQLVTCDFHSHGLKHPSLLIKLYLLFEEIDCVSRSLRAHGKNGYGWCWESPVLSRE